MMEDMSPNRRAPKYAYPTPDKILAERTRRGMNQSEAAKHIGVSLRQWQYYEEGRPPSPAVAKLLTMFVAGKKIP